MELYHCGSEKDCGLLPNTKERMKFYWFNKHCCVPECFNSSTEGEGCFKEYFDLPAEPQARSKWLKAVFVEDGENLKVCEEHFKDDDVFRDKNNRKKLRVNSVPSMKLPKHICTACLGAKDNLGQSLNFQPKQCRCNSPSAPLQPIYQLSSVSKRTRIKWTAEEKKTLLKAIKKYGDMKVGNSNLRINWANVVSHCRSNGCFGNEKELKSVWQNMRTNATKVYRNDIFGSRLDRKVSRFLYGKPSKKSRESPAAGSASNERFSSSQQNMDSTDEEDEEFQEPITHKIIQDFPEVEDVEEISGQEEIGESRTRIEEEGEEEDEDQDSEQYYTISDVEELFHIQIRPKPPKAPMEVISLLSSDEET